MDEKELAREELEKAVGGRRTKRVEESLRQPKRTTGLIVSAAEQLESPKGIKR
jgi:hypothetical protein